MQMNDAVSLVRILEAIEKSIDAGRPDVAKEQVHILKDALLKMMANA